MSDTEPSTADTQPPTGESEVVHPDLVTDDRLERDADGDGGAVEQVEAVTQPAKVMRIGSMVKQLLDEVRNAGLDEASRERLAEVYERSVTEVSEALSPDLQEELRSLALPFDHEEVPSEAELRVAKAQLVGWLEGLFHGIQASMMAQQMAMRVQRQQTPELPGGSPMQPGGLGERPDGDRPGTYL